MQTKNKNVPATKTNKSHQSKKNYNQNRYVNCMIHYLDLDQWIPEKHGITEENLQKFLLH